MLKISPYLTVLIGLLLISGPFYYASAVEAPAEDQYCGCCQGTCDGCCCTETQLPQNTDGGEPDHACQCDITDIPDDPELPTGLPSTRLSNETSESYYCLIYINEFSGKTCQSKLARTESLPPVTTRPAFVLFSAILI